MVTAMAVGLFVTLGAPLAAKPDFSQSTVTPTPAAVVEGGVVTFTVQLRNTGDQDSPRTEIDLELPLEGMFVDLTGFPGVTIGRPGKHATGIVALPAGGSAAFQFRVVAPRDSGGHVLTPDIRVRNLYLGAEFYGGAEVDIDTRSRHDGVAIGRFRIAPAGLAVLAVLALFPILAVLYSRRTRSMGPIAAVVIAVGSGRSSPRWRIATGVRCTSGARRPAQSSTAVCASRPRPRRPSNAISTDGGAARRRPTRRCSRSNTRWTGAR
jgi:hypothetical protein